ncbi:sigma-54-dependent transcriptional regulator [Oleidesulfovibrio alaskensis]|uniref:sigma-54-dependent transcriptional regulator n=1 Tax=Oleidesulfovibrio alaskensis TaxID=58180 RepID=UPI00040C3808|nr:sigma-54 dependent transcriptional regulator [Oleidesulfovibrio alaskensis]
MSEHILLIEDDNAFQEMLSEALRSRGYAVSSASRAEEGISMARQHDFDLILTDVMLPGMSGVEAIPQLREAAPGSDIIVMTAYSTRELALEAIRLGAYDFFSKPFSLKELDIVVRRALEKRRLQKEVTTLRETLRHDSPVQRIIGDSAPMRAVKTLVEKVAPLDSTVLITGESGTGKELVSDTLRALSGRAGAPFVKVNCAAIPEHLFENELFGHEKGAFTGATSAQPGKFELAQGGTLLLDEIGDMPAGIQPKLLRAVEEKQIERLGGRRPVAVNVRIIAATNQNLRELVARKAFREDLYYRLGVAVIMLPPLRDRKEDIPRLAEHILRKLGLTLGIPVHGITAAAVQALMNHHWPGNVRQLANLLERAAISAQGRITAQDIAAALAVQNGTSTQPCTAQSPHDAPAAEDCLRMPLRETLHQMERNLLLEALRRAEGSQKNAAALLGLTPKNMWAKLQKHQIRI